MEKAFTILFSDSTWITILNGMFATVKISCGAVFFGTILGFLICALRMNRNFVINTIARLYIAIIRGSPVLMLLMLLYYVVFAKSSLDAQWIAIFTFSLNSAAYIAELLRSAISATNPGQVEAARTLGFSKLQAFFLITLPQSLKIAKPVYESTIINLIQWTSVVGYVTITDLTRVINTVSARTMQPVIMICVGIILYLALAYIVKGIFVLSEVKTWKKQ